eukprot:scaffold30786_cov12-Prasinocladus_malaysianus.AAC.1
MLFDCIYLGVGVLQGCPLRLAPAQTAIGGPRLENHRHNSSAELTALSQPRRLHAFEDKHNIINISNAHSDPVKPVAGKDQSRPACTASSFMFSRAVAVV